MAPQHVKKWPGVRAVSCVSGVVPCASGLMPVVCAVRPCDIGTVPCAQVEEAEQAEAGRRLRLLTAPAVLGRVLDQSDLEELVWVLQQSAAPPASLRLARGEGPRPGTAWGHGAAPVRQTRIQRTEGVDG